VNDKSLRSLIIRLAYKNPDLRPKLLPLLEKTAVIDLVDPRAKETVEQIIAGIKARGYAKTRANTWNHPELDSTIKLVPRRRGDELYLLDYDGSPWSARSERGLRKSVKELLGAVDRHLASKDAVLDVDITDGKFLARIPDGSTIVGSLMGKPAFRFTKEGLRWSVEILTRKGMMTWPQLVAWQKGGLTFELESQVDA
jgi:hypothetical protein